METNINIGSSQAFRLQRAVLIYGTAEHRSGFATVHKVQRPSAGAMQWMFNKDRGRYLQLVVSASRDLTALSRQEIVEIAVGDLRLFLPRVRDANLVKAHVVKEQRATFSAAPETESLRPGTESSIPNLYLAGDWTRSGWPAT